jgi:hypothetical protein
MKLLWKKARPGSWIAQIGGDAQRSHKPGRLGSIDALNLRITKVPSFEPSGSTTTLQLAVDAIIE